MTTKHLLIPLSIAVLSASVCAGNLPVLQTGLTKSYDVNGSVVTDGSAKDDGYYRAGAARSYTRDNVNQTVTDNTTKLMWQDWNETNTNGYSYVPNSGSMESAQTYCTSLSVGGYRDWRLPSIKELLSIADYSKLYPAPAIDPIFKNTSVGGYLWTPLYWSSTTTLYNNKRLYWVLNSINGSTGSTYSLNGGNIRCVRGGQ